MCKQINKLMILLITIISLTSCTTVGNVSRKTSDNTLILYHHYEQKLFSYDTNKKAVIEMDKTPNLFQFNFANNSTIFTSGDSINNEYSLIQLSNNKITELLKLGENEALFPLASDEDIYFFIHTYYNKQGNEKLDQRELLKIVEPTKSVNMEVINQATGYHFTHGVCIGDTLFFSSYNPAKDDYSVYSIQYKQPNAKLELVKESLESPELYNYNGLLVTSDKHNIYIEEKAFNKSSVNYLYNNTVLGISVNSDSDLELSLIDISNNETYYSMKKNVGFVYNANGTMTIYGEGVQDEIHVK